MSQGSKNDPMMPRLPSQLHEPRVVNALLFSRHGRPVVGPT